jgi:hypothetical protein
MSKSKTITRLPNIPVTITDDTLVTPETYIRIENAEVTIPIATSKWQNIRDRFKTMVANNPESQIFNYDMYLEREKNHKLLFIENVNSGGDFVLNILDCNTNEVYKFSLNNDIATIQSKAAEEKKMRYLEENKDIIKARHRASYLKKKNQKVTQEVKIETTNVQPAPNTNSNVASQVPGEVLTFLMSIVDHNKLAEVQNRLKSIKKEAQLLETVLNLSSNN